MKLVSSNKKKLEEFRRILPNIESVSGLDLIEVDGTPEEVVIYKSIDAGKGFVVEDTILIIDGVEIVDIKWKIEELRQLKPNTIIYAIWQVMLGYNNGKFIELYVGKVEGIINPNSSDIGYGFDPFFIPIGSENSLAKLEDDGLKDKYSARTEALKKLHVSLPIKKIEIDKVPKWFGTFQNQ
jgi:inosine/xanthosine triphosphate pyrophosphatase family protein